MAFSPPLTAIVLAEAGRQHGRLHGYGGLLGQFGALTIELIEFGLLCLCLLSFLLAMLAAHFALGRIVLSKQFGVQAFADVRSNDAAIFFANPVVETPLPGHSLQTPCAK
jgi:hypothetical protein